MLTPAQETALVASILADPALAAIPHSSDGAFDIAAAYNLTASPAFTVWRTSVETRQIMENGFVWTTVDGLAAGKARIWDWMSRLGIINPSKTNVRQGLADAFGAGSPMGLAIAPHLKRLATRAEKLFSTGTGSDASPGLMSFEGTLAYNDILQAWANNGG